MRLLIYGLGILSAIFWSIFGGYASVHLSFALWMARLAVVFSALTVCLFWQETTWERLAPDEPRTLSHHTWGMFVVIVIMGIGSTFLWPHGHPKEAELHGVLVPASDPSPPNPCKNIAPNAFVVYLGRSAVFAELFPYPVLRVSGEIVISMDKVGDAMWVSAKVFSQDERIIAEISKNEFYINQNNYFRKERPDRHTLTVYDQYGRMVLHVRFINSSAMKLLGIFNLPGSSRVLIGEEEQIFGGIRVIHGPCFGGGGGGISVP